MKPCSRCKLPKPLDAYWYDEKHNRYQARCRECNAAIKAKARQRDRKARTIDIDGTVLPLQPAYIGSSHQRCDTCAMVIACRASIQVWGTVACEQVAVQDNGWLVIVW